jgi:release factor glutamine methyltransferase
LTDFKPFIKRLEAAGSGNPKRAVEELAAHVLGCKPLEIYFKTSTAEQQMELEERVARAERGEPIQYIIGHVDFRSLKIHCDPRALIPRPETELLVEAILDSTRNSGCLQIADVGTGTGCIGLALLSELPKAEVIGVDISPNALALARENAQCLGLDKHFQTLENNLLADFEEHSLDIVVSNPPYIFSNVWRTLDSAVRDYEPRLALDGGKDGLNLIHPLVEQAASALKPGGSLFLEIGYDQGPTVFHCLERYGFQNVTIKKDLAGLDRIVCGCAEWPF